MSDHEEEVKTPRELILETRRDVAWIREAIQDIKTTNDKQDERISELESSNSRMKGRDGVLAAVVAFGVSILVSLISFFCSGGKVG